jgi:hypothetical protein
VVLLAVSLCNCKLMSSSTPALLRLVMCYVCSRSRSFVRFTFFDIKIMSVKVKVKNVTKKFKFKMRRYFCPSTRRRAC